MPAMPFSSDTSAAESSVAPLVKSEPLPSDRALMEQALFGSDKTPRIVAVETRQNDATLFHREANGDTRQEIVPFQPWILQRNLEARILPDSQEEILSGEGYNCLVKFDSWKSYLNGRQILRDERRDYLSYGSATKQFLIGTGRTLFKQMAFPDLVRMQIDIETSDLSFLAPDACIFLIVASDNRGHEALLMGEERDLLEELTHLVQTWNPDVIEGHNLYAFDLPWIRARAEAHGVDLAWGRDGSKMSVGQERNAAIGANTRPFAAHYIWGRHIIDTLFQTQRFDLAKGEISSYGLKECAKHYHIAEPDRVYLDRSDLVSLFKQDPERVKAYAIGDVRETRRLAEVVAPTEFYQTQMVPDSYQSVAVTGSGEKINSVFVRAYMERRQGVARQQAPQPYGGGYTEMRVSGVIPRIVKADVESLYPSIMLTHGVTSSSDSLGLFLPLLKELTARRIRAKKRAKEYADGDDLRRASYYDGLQGSYKLLINSFYGYLGAPFYFNDYQAAARVTEIGQEIVKNIADELEKQKATVIEIDTDGVYFQMPPGSGESEAVEVAFVAKVGRRLDEGIRLAFDGRYQTMLSLKAKNYVLVTYEGKKIFKGSSLRSRADERFGRTFLNEAVDLLLSKQTEALSAMYRDLLARIESRELGIEQLARRERVTEKTFHSEAKKRAAAVMAGMSVGEYAILYQRDDKSLALAADYAGDEDVEYYQTKLHKFAERLRAAVGDDFDALFPKPLTGAKRKAKEAEKHQMALFDL